MNRQERITRRQTRAQDDSFFNKLIASEPFRNEIGRKLADHLLSKTSDIQSLNARTRKIEDSIEHILNEIRGSAKDRIRNYVYYGER